MLLLLRIALYIQLLLGVGRYAGLITQRGLWDIHIGLGILIALVALFSLRPHPRLPGDTVRSIARFSPLITLLVGLGIFSGMVVGHPVVIVHMLLGIATVGLVEMASGRQRRRMAGSRRYS